MSIGCQSEQKSSNEEEIETEQEEVVEQTTIDAKFEFENVMDEFDTPSSTLYIVINGEKQKVTEVSGALHTVGRDEFAENEIPSEALDACHSHYGGSSYFYVIATESGVAIYEGGPNEESEASEMIWDLYKEF